MRIPDVLTGAVPGATNSNQAPERSGRGRAFDAFLAEAGRRQNVDSTPETQSSNREDSRRARTDETRSAQADRTERPSRRENNRATEAEAVNEAPAIVSEVAPNDESTQKSDEAKIDENKAVAYIAEVLQVPVETVMEWLEQLGITASDLKDPQMVSKLLQKALGAEAPAVLLTDPAVPELFKAVNEIMIELVQEAEVTLIVMPGAAETAQGTANKAADTAAYAANLEGLEVSIENGQLVVTEEVTDEEAAATAKPETARAATTANQSTQVQVNNQELMGQTLIPAEEIIAEESQAADPMLSSTTATSKVEQTVKQATALTQQVNVTDVIEQIMNQVSLTKVGGQFTEMRMTLRPESLGDIVLRVLTQNGIVMAQFEAESQRVKEALEADFNLLRDALQEQGIQFSELSVFVRQDEEERMSQFERARQGSRNRMEAINGADEEVVQEQVSYHNGVIDITA
jgi:flagellar hook-length control protein FliK